MQLGLLPKMDREAPGLLSCKDVDFFNTVYIHAICHAISQLINRLNTIQEHNIAVYMTCYIAAKDMFLYFYLTC